MTDENRAPLPEIFFRLSGSGRSPWEIHRAQPVISKLVEQNIFQGEVLDIGCGIGDNAIHIAKHAKNVRLTAIDFVCCLFFCFDDWRTSISFSTQVPKALEIAREKAERDNILIQFELVNFLDDLSSTKLAKHSFDTVLDCAVFHCFSDQDRQHFLDNLQYVIKPAGLYIQLCISEKETRINIGPRYIKKSDLTSLFSPANGWTIESIEDVIFISRSESPLGLESQAYLSLIRRHSSTLIEH